MTLPLLRRVCGSGSLKEQLTLPELLTKAWGRPGALVYYGGT